MRLQTKVLGIAAVIFISHFSISQYLGHEKTKADLIDSIREEARTVRGILMSVREVYQNVFLDHDIPLTRKTIHFLPAHSLSRISTNFQKWVNSGLTFNNVSDKPRNPSNLADDIEKEAMDYFRNNPKEVERLVPFINKNGESFFHFSQPIWITERCLSCHGDQSKAPESIRDRYMKGYKYELGDLRGLMSVKVPADVIKIRVKDHLLQNILTHGIGFLLTYLLIILFFKSSVLKRITQLKHAAEVFSQGDSNINIDTDGDDEISEVGRAFMAMADKVAKRERDLKVQKSLFAAMSESNKSIMQMESPDELYKSICRIAVDYGGLDFAWIGSYLEDEQKIIPVGSAGSAVDLLKHAEFVTDEKRYKSSGAVSVAVVEQRVVVVNDINEDRDGNSWQQLFREHGIKSLAAIPCLKGKLMIGVFTVYSKQKNFFNHAIIQLLEEMAADIVFGVDNYLNEQERRLLESKLQG